MGNALLIPRHSLNAFFGSPLQLDVRTGGSQQNRTAHFAFSGVHKFPRGIRQISICISQVFRKKETRLPERVFTGEGPPTPEDWEGGKSLRSGTGAWMPVGVGL